MKKSSVVLVACFFLWTAFAALWVICARDRVYSENEKRYLSTAPQVNWDSVMSGKFSGDVEDWLNDQFPARETWAGINARFEQATGLNGNSGVYLLRDGSLVRTPARDDVRVTAMAAGKVSAFAEAAGVPVRFMLVPSAGYMREDDLPAAHFGYPDGEIMDRVRGQLSEKVEWIDLRDALAARMNEKLYFSTDHHWTSLGAYVGYEAYCAAAGLTARSQSEYAVETAQDFKGTNWSTACLWDLPGEEIEMWVEPGLTVTTRIPETQAERDGMLFRERLDEMDKYTVFLDGNHALTTIDNPDSEGGVLLIVKDSYAHVFAPFLAGHYKRIILVDMRYYHAPLTDLCREEGVTDALVLYSVGTFVEASDLAFLR